MFAEVYKYCHEGLRKKSRLENNLFRFIEVQMNNPDHQKSDSFSSFSDKFLKTKTAEELKLNNKNLYTSIKYTQYKYYNK